jgi:hypothetical protein
MEITQERLKELLRYDPDTGFFFWRKAKGGWGRPGRPAGGTNGEGYRQIGIDRRYFYAHRLVWLYVHGEFPTNCIDHINGNRSDNRLANLRSATVQENNFNVRAVRAASGFVGVYWDERSKKWRASIKANGSATTLGRFSTPEAAHEAYQSAKRILHAIG